MSGRHGPLEIDAKLDLLVGETTTITVHDTRANVVLLEIELDPPQLAAALGRRSRVPCRAKLPGWQHAGMVHELRNFEFPFPGYDLYAGGGDQWQAAFRQATRCAPDGWTPDQHFGSHGSFFEKDGEPWARCTIRRWTDPEDEPTDPGEEA